MSNVDERLAPSRGEHRDLDERARRAASRLLAAQAISVPIVAGLMWWLRRSFLDGVDCTTLGPYDCGYDGGLAAAYGVVVGCLFLIAGAGAWAISRRSPRAGLVAGGLVAAAWLVIAAVLLAATRT